MAIRIYREIAAQIAEQLHTGPSRAKMMDDDCDRQPIEWFIAIQKQLSRIIPEKEGLDHKEFLSAMEEISKLAIRAQHSVDLHVAAGEVIDWVKAHGGTIRNDPL